jgi:hypothetical protein
VSKIAFLAATAGTMSTSTSNDDEQYFDTISNADNESSNLQGDIVVGHDIGKML